MEETKKNKVLIDLSDLKDPNCGFGQIAINYSKQFAALSVDDLHFIYLLPRGNKEFYGNNVTCIPTTHPIIHKWFPFTLPKVDIWHSVNQFNKLHRNDRNSKFIFTLNSATLL